MFGGEPDARRVRGEQFRHGGAPDGDGHSEAVFQQLQPAHEGLRSADEDGRDQSTELARLVQSQHTERWRHERLIAVLPAPILVTDSDGKVRTANGSAAALLNLPVARMVRESLFAFVDAADRAELRRLLADAVDAKRDLRAIVVMCPYRGQPIHVELAATMREDPATGDCEVTWVLLGDGVVSQPAVTTKTRGRHLARSLVELTQLPMRASGVSEVLAPMAEACQRAFAHTVAASINLGDQSRPDLVATRSKLAQSLDGAQLTAGEGPSQTAWNQRSTVRSNDLRADPRWPRLQRHLADSPVKSVVAVPIRFGDEVVGILNLYSLDDHLADAAAVESAEFLATTVAAVLHEAEAKSELENSAKQLHTALESRSTIDQAKGMIMASRRCGADQAFDILVQMSSRANVKLRDIAARMVEEASQGIEALPDQRPSGGRGPVEG